MTTDQKTAFTDADIVMTLRIQLERLSADASVDQVAYRSDYGVTSESLSLAKPTALVMHPGPMNRGVEIDGDIADHPDRSLILAQVAMGVPTRMAVLEFASSL